MLLEVSGPVGREAHIRRREAASGDVYKEAGRHIWNHTLVSVLPLSHSLQETHGDHV